MARPRNPHNPPSMRRAPRPSSTSQPTAGSSNAKNGKRKAKLAAREEEEAAEVEEEQGVRKRKRVREEEGEEGGKKRRVSRKAVQEEEQEEEAEEDEEDEEAVSKRKEKRRKRTSGDDSGRPQHKKRRRVSQDEAPAQDEEAPEEEEEADEEEEHLSYKSTSHSITLSKILKRWKPLTRTSQTTFSSLIGDSISSALSTLPRQRPSLAPHLQTLTHRTRRVLTKIRAPPTTVGSTKSAEIELPDFEGLLGKVTGLQGVLAEEHKAMARLEKAVKEEKRALQADKTELSEFQKKRRAVEKAESKDAAQKLHPAIQSLYAPAGPSASGGQGNRLWVAEAAARGIAERAALLGKHSDDENEEEEEVYNMDEDPFLQSLARKLLPILAPAGIQVAEVGAEVRSLVARAREVVE